MSFKAALLAGAKGGGSSTYRNRPDNLRSTDTFEVLLGLGAGRIKLAPGGLQNLFVNDVPVEDGQGKANFTDFATTLFDGDPTILNPVKLQLGSSAGMNAINLTLTNTSATAPGDWKNGTITQPGVDFIDLRFVVQQLYNQTKNGIDNATASIEVQLRPSGAANWINPLQTTSGATYNQDGVPSALPGTTVYFMRQAVIADANSSTGYSWNDSAPGYVQVTGKTTSPFVKELRIAVPNTGAYANKTWDIRCRLVEIDYQVTGTNGENEVHRTITWESAGGVSSAPIGGNEDWRGLSYLQLYGKASDQITGIPTVQGIYDLDLYLVPPSSVWDPTTRAYTGAAWDGVTTQLAWTQCPAWQIKKLIEDDLSGVSALAPGSTLNKWDALDASKWFSELVPDGKGGQQPRYSLNWFLEQPMQVHDLVNYLAGAVGSYAWDEGDGKWRLKVEKPETPQMIFTKETIAGEFVYQHTDVDTRYNDITGVYRDRDNRYAESRVRVFNQADIDATGHRPTSIALVGCDNRQEALRRIYIRLLTALNEKRMVTFKTNRIAGLLEPLSVIGIADGDLNSNSAIRSTGRVVKRRTNFIRNSAFAGATVGAPGAIPNSGTPGSAAGINASIVGTGVDSEGFEYVDIRWAGTSTSTSAPVWFFDAARLADTPAAAVGDTWTSSIDVKVVGGSTAGLSRMAIGTYEYNSDGSAITGSSNTTFTPTAAYTQQKHTRTFTGATTAHARTLFFLNTGAAGVTVDCTFRFRKPQLEKADAPTGYIRTTNGPADAITLRDTLRLETGVAYQISLTVPNPNYTPDATAQPSSADWRKPTITQTLNVVNTTAQRGDVYDIYLDNALPANTPEFATVALTAPGLPALPKQYRVLGIQPDDDGEWATISAIEIYTSKWTESDAITEDAVNSQVSDKTVNPPLVPSAGMFRTDSYSSGTTNRRVLVASWDRPAGQLIGGYKVVYRYNGGPWVTLLENTQDQFYELSDPPPGTYEFQIFTLDRRGLKSLPLDGTVSLDDTSIIPPTGLLTNESHTVAAASDGTGFDLSQAGGQFLLYGAAGLIQASEVTFSVEASSGATATIDANGNYAITDLSADTATITFRAVWDIYSAPVDKTYTISKSKAGTAGATGASAKLLFVISDRQTVAFDSAGNPTPADQTTTFKAQKQNTTAAVTWSITDINGVAQNAATCLSATTGDTVTMTEAQFATACNGTTGVIVKGSLTDGATLTDQISVVKVAQGSPGAPGAPGDTGPAGPTVGLTVDYATFDFIDGVPFNSAQVITITATKQNTTEALTWSTTPNVTLGGTGDSRTLTIDNFGTNQNVVITVTGNTSGAKASVSITRNSQTTPNDSIIPDSGWKTGVDGGSLNSPWRRSGLIRTALL